MVEARVEANLLFGMLGFQMGLIDQSALVAAFHAWSHARDRSMAEILVQKADSRIMPPGVLRVMRYPANRAGPSRLWDTLPFTGLRVMQGASRTTIIGRMERAGTWFINPSLSRIFYDCPMCKGWISSSHERLPKRGLRTYVDFQM